MTAETPIDAAGLAELRASVATARLCDAYDDGGPGDYTHSPETVDRLLALIDQQAHDICELGEAVGRAEWRMRELAARIAELEAALLAVRDEARRENGSWIHLRRAISVACAAAIERGEHRPA